jgi:hypothetical protein
MRFIITAQAAADEKKADSEQAFDEKLFIAYMKFNEEMHKAGVLIASEGLNPASPGARVEELVGGFYLIEVKSLDEAIQWALRAPFGMGSDDVLEIRQLTGAGDLPPEIVKMITDAAPTWSAAAWLGRQ